MSRPPRVAVLSAHWGQEGSEESFVTRQVASALAGVAEVHVLAAGQGDLPPAMDGALRVTPVAGEPADELRARFLVTAFVGGLSGRLLRWSPPAGRRLARDGIPRSVQRELRSLNGGPLRGAMATLTEIAPASVVLAGYRHTGARLDLSGLAAGVRTVLLPLAGTDPQLELPVYDDVFASADRVVTITRTEHDALRRREAVGPLTRAAPALRVRASAGVNGLPDLRHTSYVLVLQAPDEDPSRDGAQGLAHYIAARYRRRAVVAVGERALTTWRGGRSTTVHRRTVRTDLWKLMAGAHATVDLRSAGVLGREALESMLYGTPVVVPSGSIAREHAEDGNAGLWFEDPAELVACLEALEAPGLRPTLSSNAKTFASRNYGDTAGFVARVRAAVLGTGQPTSPCASS